MIVGLEPALSNIRDFVVGNPTLTVVLFILALGLFLLRFIDQALVARRRRRRSETRARVLSRLTRRLKVYAGVGEFDAFSASIRGASDTVVIELFCELACEKGYSDSGYKAPAANGTLCRLLRSPKRANVGVGLHDRASTLDIVAIREFRDELSRGHCPRGYLIHLGPLSREIEGRLAKISELFSIKVVTMATFRAFFNTQRGSAESQKPSQAHAVAG